MAIDDARVVLAEEDWIKHLLPCKSKSKYSCKARDSLYFGVRSFTLRPLKHPGIFTTFPFPFIQF
jgi:hypothetical protein